MGIFGEFGNCEFGGGFGDFCRRKVFLSKVLYQLLLLEYYKFKDPVQWRLF